MKRTRDRLIAAGAVIVLIALASAVVALVLDAQNSAIKTREDLRLEQTRALANNMESLIHSIFVSSAGVNGAPGAWKLKPNDPDDAKKLQPQAPSQRTGAILVDRTGTILNGSLLRDPSVIGTKLERDGLDRVLAGDPAILPSGPGLTTSRLTLGLAIPVHDASGQLAGAVVNESEIAPGVGLSLLVAEQKAGRTGSFSYVDRHGVVVASSNDSLLAKPLVDAASKGFTPGFHRAGGKVAAIADIPSAHWHLVFLQNTGEFQGDLTGPLQTALLLFLAVVAAIGVFAAVSLLRRLQAAREEQARLREIGDAREEFTSIVSHELRTPVAGLLGFLQTTVDHWDAMSDPERRRAVGRAFTNARSLQTLTSDVLDSASIEARTLAYRFDTLDLRSCVDEAIEAIQDVAPDRTVTFTKPTDAVLVRADSLRLRQVLGNLLDNAVKSSAPDAPIDVSITSDGRMASVAVHDRGPGIAPEEREQIFEKFTRGRSGVGRGTGLGLYISRHIVEAHGGEIGAESPEGEAGARIRFTIPVVAG